MQVYLIRNGQGEYKIGHTSKSMRERISGLQTGASSDLEVVCTFETLRARKIEGILHRRHRSKRLKGEWFSLNIEDELSFELDCRKIEDMLSFLENNKI